MASLITLRPLANGDEEAERLEMLLEGIADLRAGLLPFTATTAVLNHVGGPGQHVVTF